METKKIFTVVGKDYENSNLLGAFSSIEKADKIVSFVKKNAKFTFNEFEAKETVIDELPFFKRSLSMSAGNFLRGEHNFLLTYCDFHGATEHPELYEAEFVCRRNNFQLPFPKNGFHTTWEELFLRGTEMEFTVTISRRLTESDLEKDSLDLKEKAIQLLHEVSTDWFSRVAEDYPVTCVYVEGQQMYFYIYRKTEADYAISDQEKKEIENGLTIKEGEQLDKYIFSTKNGQKFLDQMKAKFDV